MPGGDRTGPSGEGPMTGRGLGYCRESDVPGNAYMRPFFGRGFGFGRRRGRGMRRGPGYRAGWGDPVRLYPDEVSYPRKNEAEMLRQQAKHLEDLLVKINKQINLMEEQEQKDKNEKNDKK